MYEIDLSTLILIGLDENNTRIVTLEDDFNIKNSCKKIVDNSCKFFGSTLTDKIKSTGRLINITSKAPIIIEETRNLIFFPLKSTRENNNIWISFNNLISYSKNNHETILKFKGEKEVKIDFSYYIVDNQVTRCMILDYVNNKRRKSLEK